MDTVTAIQEFIKMMEYYQADCTYLRNPDGDTSILGARPEYKALKVIASLPNESKDKPSTTLTMEQVEAIQTGRGYTQSSNDKPSPNFDTYTSHQKLKEPEEDCPECQTTMVHGKCPFDTETKKKPEPEFIIQVNEYLSEDAYNRWKEQLKGTPLEGKFLLLEGVANVIKI